MYIHIHDLQKHKLWARRAWHTQTSVILRRLLRFPPHISAACSKLKSDNGGPSLLWFLWDTSRFKIRSISVIILFSQYKLHTHTQALPFSDTNLHLKIARCDIYELAGKDVPVEICITGYSKRFLFLVSLVLAEVDVTEVVTRLSDTVSTLVGCVSLGQSVCGESTCVSRGESSHCKSVPLENPLVA